MVVVLIGHPGSQKIVKASKHLTTKYLPGFNVIYLNYYGPINGWSRYIAGFLAYLTDEYIVFALDDYLLASPIDMSIFNAALQEMNDEVVCAKLCQSTPEEHNEYPVTTQYCIWDRLNLIHMLQQTTTPWDFEINGSRLFKKKVILRTCLEYSANSSISSRWEGIRLDGLREDDLTFLKENGYV